MDNKVLNDDFSRVKIQLRERSTRHKCFWCKKHILKDGCDFGCQCTSCFFHNEIDLASDSAYSYKWLKNNMKFYKKLFYEGVSLERELIDKWKKGQQNTIDKSGSKINDWFTDLEGKNNRNKLIPNDPEYYIILDLYYIYHGKKEIKRYGYTYHCQLCGTELIHKYYIKHKEKPVCILIGEECADAFYFADILTRKLKIKMDSMIRHQFQTNKSIMKKNILTELKKNSKNVVDLNRDLHIVAKFGRKNYPNPPGPERLAQILIKFTKF